MRLQMGFMKESLICAIEGLRRIRFALIFTFCFPLVALANECERVITGVESFFSEMTKGLLLRPTQWVLFELYRTRFGDPDTSLGGHKLEDFVRLIEKHPDLEKPLFREQLLERARLVYAPPQEQADFFRRQLNSPICQERCRLQVL